MNKNMKIVGSSAHTTEERHPDDYYATDSDDFETFLHQLSLDGFTLSPQIWEPACGEGHIAKVLERWGHEVTATDLHDRGYGKRHDFLSEENFLFTYSDFRAPTSWPGDIITNPPYKGSIDIDFVKKSLEYVEPGRYVMMLFKTIWQNSKGRFELFQMHKPKYIYNYSFRIRIYKGGVGESNNALDYSWFVWQKGFTGETKTRFIPNPKWGYTDFKNVEQ